MATVTQHAPGMFCWTQLGTRDEEGARKFYSGLFGWSDEKTSANGQDFTVVKKNDKAVGAIMGQAANQDSPSWLPFVAVEDLDEVVSHVREEGGKILMQPFEVGPNGRFAVFEDPTGGVFAVWKAGEKAGAEIVNETGAMCWNELITTDSEEAGAFYEGIFGWKREPMPNPGGGSGTYTIFKLGSDQAGGMMTARPEMHLKRAFWMVYFAVADCDQITARAEQLGGKVMMPPTDIPTVGRFATIRDPQGAAFSIIKPMRS